MEIQPVRVQKVYQLVLQQLRQLVAEGVLKPGDRLPPERELASQLQVSRTSTREALRALEIQGLLQIRPRGGTFIRQTDVQALIDALDHLLDGDSTSSVLEMLEVRRILESECAAIAARRRTSHDLSGMEESIKDMERYENDEEQGLEADLRFHFFVARATGNSALIGLMNALGAKMKETIRATRRSRFSVPGRFLETLEEHMEIYASIRNRNSVRARKLMKKHITNVRDEMFRQKKSRQALSGQNSENKNAPVQAHRTPI